MATTVHCYLSKCIHQDHEKCICLKDDISLDEDHSCVGGCDEGWEFEEEEDNEDKDSGFPQCYWCAHRFVSPHGWPCNNCCQNDFLAWDKQVETNMFVRKEW